MLKHILAAAACLSLIGCGGADKRETPPPPTPAQQAMKDLSTQQQAYVSQTSERINAIAKFSKDMRARAAQVDRTKAKKMQNASEDLNLLLRDAIKELNDVSRAAPQNWVDEKRDVEKTMSRAETKYSDSVQLMQ